MAIKLITSREVFEHLKQIIDFPDGVLGVTLVLEHEEPARVTVTHYAHPVVPVQGVNDGD